MIAYDHVIQPHPKTLERSIYGTITMGDWVRNQPRDLIERNVVYAESPNKIFNVLDIFLMGLRGKQGLEQPSTAMY